MVIIIIFCRWYGFLSYILLSTTSTRYIKVKFKNILSRLIYIRTFNIILYICLPIYAIFSFTKSCFEFEKMFFASRHAVLKKQSIIA